jgi:hypothetical protein
MDRPYSRYSPTTDPSGTPGAYGSRRTGGYTDVETAVIDDRARRPRGEYGHAYESDVQDYDRYSDENADENGEYGEIRTYHDPIDRRWIWVAGVAGAILLVAVICTAVILGGGDSGSVSKTVIPPLPTTALATSTAPSVVAAPPAPVLPSAPLSPETVTTVPPSPTASAVPAPVDVAPSPRIVTYQVTGTRAMIDLVTVVYTDAQGALQTEFNVALPWSRTVTLDPGVELKSVTATSLTGQLNCAITDAAGATIVAQTNPSMLATCTK